MNNHESIFSAFLDALGVPHTVAYSDSRFRSMTFQSLYGLSKLLQEYGVATQAIEVPDKEAALTGLSVPFLAGTADTFVIVESIGDSGIVVNDGNASSTLSTPDFCNLWTGVVLAASPSDGAAEPDYGGHRIIELATKAKKWILAFSIMFLLGYFFISAELWRHPSTIFLTLINIGGLFITYQLLLKSLNIHSDTGDSICGIIDRTGCHTVLGTSAAKFFGLFSWSEVGFAYFGISLAAMLMFPAIMPQLALINACCCPFSFWSIWYQKYRAKAWCTLCLITQACLWLSLTAYILGGWFTAGQLFTWALPALVAAYVAALLGLNAIMPKFDNNEKEN